MRYLITYKGKTGGGQFMRNSYFTNNWDYDGVITGVEDWVVFDLLKEEYTDDGINWRMITDDDYDPDNDD